MATKSAKMTIFKGFPIKNKPLFSRQSLILAQETKIRTTEKHQNHKTYLLHKYNEKTSYPISNFYAPDALSPIGWQRTATV
jgi:hypothetical protein